MAISLIGGGLGGGVGLAQPRRTAAAAAFDFESYPGFLANWDADALTEGDTAEITTITDSGSNAYHAPKGSATGAVMATSVFTGAKTKAIRFATNERAYYDVPTAVRTALDSTGVGTAYYVYVKRASTDRPPLQVGSGDSTYSATSTTLAFMATNGSSSTTAVSVDTFYVITVQFDSASKISCWLNGTLMNNYPSGVKTLGVRNPITIGTDAVTDCEGDLGQALLYSAAHDASDRAAIEAQLTSDWVGI